MTGDLILTTHFHEVPVRVIQREGYQSTIPLNDIADGIGYDRAGLRKIIYRNLKQFSPFTCKVVTASQGDQRREITCLTRDGIIGLLMRLDLNRIQSEAKQDRVLSFQHWAMKMLGQVMEGERLEPVKPTRPVPEVLEENFKIGELMHTYAGVSKPIACSVSIARTEDETGANLTWCKGMLPAASESTGRLIPSEIGEQIGISARTVNQTLAELGFQATGHDGWRLTLAGRNWGEEYPFTARSGHSGYQIKWKPGVIRKIEERLYGLQQFDQGHITGYLS